MTWATAEELEQMNNDLQKAVLQDIQVANLERLNAILSNNEEDEEQE